MSQNAGHPGQSKGVEFHRIILPLKDTIGIQDQRTVGIVLYFNVKTVTYLKVDFVNYCRTYPSCSLELSQKANLPYLILNCLWHIDSECQFQPYVGHFE